MSAEPPSFADVEAAARRIAGRAHRTPVATCAAIDAAAGRRVFLKCENLQRAGAFKFRGAANALARMSDAEARRGVVTHSSGNHAQALALAAKLRGVPAHVVMPSNAPAVKRRAVEGYGALLVECEPTLEARERTAAAVVARTGARFVHPYDHADVIAGQGTAALELLEDVPDLDAIVAPVGGGGLVGGSAIAARGARPAVRVIAAEPAGADDAARSKAAGRLVPQTTPKTIADGLRTSLGSLTWPLLRDLVERVVVVEEEEIVSAMRMLFERAKLVVEPSGAASLAAVLGPALRASPGIERVGVILSGGNVDLDALPW
ncbi:MAG TPA: pyridoxal-phosphate dependent enzyme [Myxococcota bacterium]|nr:pyridoxal-phosphate dependent enzyme [Myxococcota bacterium]